MGLFADSMVFYRWFVGLLQFSVVVVAQRQGESMFVLPFCWNFANACGFSVLGYPVKLNGQVSNAIPF